MLMMMMVMIMIIYGDEDHDDQARSKAMLLNAFQSEDLTYVFFIRWMMMFFSKYWNFLRSKELILWKLDLKPLGSIICNIDIACKLTKHMSIYIYMYIYNIHITYIIEGSLEVKLPTIWTVEKQRWKESEEKRSEERRGRCAKR